MTTAAEVGLIGAEDLDHLWFAVSAGRVLVTQDADFLRLHEEGVPHAGVVYCQQQSKTAGEILRFLLLFHAALLSEEMTNSVEFRWQTGLAPPTSPLQPPISIRYRWRFNFKKTSRSKARSAGGALN